MLEMDGGKRDGWREKTRGEMSAGPLGHHNVEGGDFWLQLHCGLFCGDSWDEGEQVRSKSQAT